MARASSLFFLIYFYTSIVFAYGVEAGMLSFNEEDQMTVLGETRALQTTVYGGNINFDKWFPKKLKYKDKIWTRSYKYGLLGGAGVGRAHVTPKHNDITFTQTNLLAYWIYAGPGIRYTLAESNVEVGLIAPIYFRSIDYKLPATNTSFNNKTRLIPSIGFELVWGYNQRFNITQRMTFAIGPKVSPIWMAGVCYEF